MSSSSYSQIQRPRNQGLEASRLLWPSILSVYQGSTQDKNKHCHLFNLQLGFDNDLTRSKFRVLINYASERIRRAENRTANIPAIIEQVPTTVDLTYSKDFDFGNGEYELSLKAQNIFGEDYEAFQEGNGQEVIVDGYDRGTAFSIGLNTRF